MTTDTVNTVRIAEIKREIEATTAALTPLLQKAELLRRELRDLESRLFISVNKIKREDVEMSSGIGKPHFLHIKSFIDWMLAHTTKNWAEWNGTIYRTSDLMQNRMPYDMPGRIEHLP